MGHVQHGIPVDLATRLVLAMGANTAVETGTFHGDTTADLAGMVSQVWSIEIDEELAARAEQRFSSNSSIHVERGPSPVVLARIADKVQGPALFWLDAHYLPFTDGDPKAFCPALQEIAAVQRFDGVKESCILIDDARLFLGPHVFQESADWPTLIEVIDALRMDAERHITVLDDVIIAVPTYLRAVVDTWWLEKSRARKGFEFHSYLYHETVEPTPAEAVRRLIRSFTPRPIIHMVARRRSQRS